MLLALEHGRTMREIFVEIFEQELEHYPECPKSHMPNKVTQKAIENTQPVCASSSAEARQKKSPRKATTVEELFKKLDQ
jgi:hypothetical protein